jgi:hypothetical protein
LWARSIRNRDHSPNDVRPQCTSICLDPKDRHHVTTPKAFKLTYQCSPVPEFSLHTTPDSTDSMSFHKDPPIPLQPNRCPVSVAMTDKDPSVRDNTMKRDFRFWGVFAAIMVSAFTSALDLVRCSCWSVEPVLNSLRLRSLPHFLSSQTSCMGRSLSGLVLRTPCLRPRFSQ